MWLLVADESAKPLRPQRFLAVNLADPRQNWAIPRRCADQFRAKVAIAAVISCRPFRLPTSRKLSLPPKYLRTLMSDIDVTTNLLSDLDTRQDEVIRDLDELNRQIEKLTRDWTHGFAEINDAA
jgi:hypothetical protein